MKGKKIDRDRKKTADAKKYADSLDSEMLSYLPVKFLGDLRERIELEIKDRRESESPRYKIPPTPLRVLNFDGHNLYLIRASPMKVKISIRNEESNIKYCLAKIGVTGTKNSESDNYRDRFNVLKNAWNNGNEKTDQKDHIMRIWKPRMSKDDELYMQKIIEIAKKDKKKDKKNRLASDFTDVGLLIPNCSRRESILREIILGKDTMTTLTRYDVDYEVKMKKRDYNELLGLGNESAITEFAIIPIKLFNTIRKEFLAENLRTIQQVNDIVHPYREAFPKHEQVFDIIIGDYNVSVQY